MILPDKFTYPFRYVPHPLVRDAAKKLIATIDASPVLHEVFSEGKMLGVLICSSDNTEASPLFHRITTSDDPNLMALWAFSGLAGGQSHIGGFVPPIFDTTTLPELRGRLSAEESAALQDRLFGSYVVCNAQGVEQSIREVFAHRGLVPPGGTGECAGPKLLNFAYGQGLKPLAMGEFWYGHSPEGGEVRQHGRFYPSCTGKCGPLLSFMMQGLDVEANPLQRIPAGSGIRTVYEDEYLLAADKPSGMLCAPGLTGTPSLIELLSRNCGPLYSIHRLDMDTSGLIIYAKTPEAQAAMQRLFENRQVEKTYLAHLCAGTRPWRGRKTGTIALPLAPDYYDRPRQIVDKVNGKQAVTEFEILEIFPDGEMDVRFRPKTGRTHQLRVHAASPLGLGRPIKGDALYGDPDGKRLMLHAETLTFAHPFTGEILTVTSDNKNGKA